VKQTGVTIFKGGEWGGGGAHAETREWRGNISSPLKTLRCTEREGGSFVREGVYRKAASRKRDMQDKVPI